jgi:putative DNA primase/helicase
MSADITNTDAWGMARKLAALPVPDDAQFSPMVRSILRMNGNGEALIRDLMSTSPIISRAIMAVDPTADAPDETTADELNRKPDDDDIAQMFMRAQAAGVAFFYGTWHRYQAGVWVPEEDGAVAKRVREFMRPLRKNGVSITANKVQSVTKLAAMDFAVESHELRAMAGERRKYVNLANGLFNLETMTLEAHRPDLYFLAQLPFAYDPDPECPNFERYLESSLVDEAGAPDGQMINLVCQALGYSMTARTDLQAAFWCVGKPASGKSTLISLIRNLMGSLHTTIDLNQLGTNRFLLSGMVGKRAVTFTEASANTVLDDALFKAVVGGTDELQADVKNKTAITFVPEAKLWWAMNEAPRTKDRTGALLRRLRPILFPRTIPQEKRVANLDERLASELPGIFNLCMMRYRIAVEAGDLIRPAASQQWLSEYERRNDTERTFIEDMCVTEADATVASSYLYQSYKSWCEDNGFKPKNMNQAAEDWQRLGLTKLRKNDGNYWKGARVK